MSEATPSKVPADIHHLDDINVRAIVMWGVVSIAVTVISILGLHAMYNWFAATQLEVKSYQAKYESAANEIDKQQGKLVAAPTWVNKEAGIVSVPIDRAIEITVNEYQRQQE